MSVSQTADHSQITGPPFITLVDIDGHPVPTGEKGLPPHDPDDPEGWLESIEIDAIHYEISDPAERAALEAAHFEEVCDLADAPSPGEQRWLTLMWSGPLPAVAGGQPDICDAPAWTDADRSDFESWLASVDADYLPANQVSPEELAQLAAHGCV
jgi:hypothetical protein